MANKYIFQLRRGTRYVDNSGNTLLDDNGKPVRDDWAAYTAQENHLNPLDGELVVEFEYNPTTGKKTPRFKLGCDDQIFANLEYISPDSFILPTQATVTIVPDGWMMVDCDGNIIDSNGNIVGVDGTITTEGYYEVDENGKIIDNEEKILKNRYVQFVALSGAASSLALSC